MTQARRQLVNPNRQSPSIASTGLDNFTRRSSTIPERCDLMLQNKQKLAQELLAGEAETNLTELSDAELLILVKLDIHAIGI
jgi:hypothetical protein